LATRAHQLELEHASLFRVRAYRRAAEAILGLDRPVTDLVELGGRKKLAEIPGIGRSLSVTIEKLVRGESEKNETTEGAEAVNAGIINGVV
jgi:DNA polymerase (family 10)